MQLSKQTVELIEKDILPRAEALGCAVTTLACGATVIDMGIHAPGSWEAGRLFTQVSLGGLGEVSFSRFCQGRIDLPAVTVTLPHPQEASLSSQFSSWKIKQTGSYRLYGFGSGPARAIARQDDIARMWHYRDSWHATALCVQTAEMPDDEIALEVSRACNVDPSCVYLLAATTGSLVGCIQICARMPEVALWGLAVNGFPLETVLCFDGYGVVAPCARDELLAMDRVNNSIFYGSYARLLVDCEDDAIERILPTMSFADTIHAGKTFGELFEEANHNIYNMDLSVHKVAVCELNNIRSGRSFRAGSFNPDMLYTSFYGS
jgi:methenyltetrahydromethanopterin cyclohydrolase